jgi:dihydrodipicolinate synthase/N-acetylneuraminate lyase
MHIPEGAIVAMMTPFDIQGRISEVETRKLVNFLIDKGVDGIFPVASCGEYTHMDMGERKFLIDVVMDEARSRVDIIPGTGATCYHQSIELANYAKDKGCAGIVLHGPYFFQNTADVVEGHLRKVAENVDIPMFLYNIPFFANEVTPQIAERLCSMPNVVGIKESSGNMVNVMNLLEMTRKVDPDFRVLVGAEEILLPALLMGGRGCMTATTGIMPEFMTGIYKAFKNKNLNLAYNLQFAILPLIREMKSVNFPQGFKEALSLRGVEMGPPKMNYSPESLAKISDLKARLEIEMKNLLENYFPGTPLKHRFEDRSIMAKLQYPQVTIPQSLAKEKKFTDCLLCGMCEGDNCIFVESGAGTTQIKDGTPVKNIASPANEIAPNQLEEIIARSVKKVLESM